jgi:hypothetical protein
MATTNGTDDTKQPDAARMVGSLGELPRDVAPPRDLWPSIAAQIAEEKARGGPEAPLVGRSRYLPTRIQWAALAAVVFALAVGMWLGRSVLPGKGVQSGTGIVASSGNPAGSGGAVQPGTGQAGTGQPGTGQAGVGQAVPAAVFVTDPRYLKEREDLIAALEAQLKTLPPQSQQKVASSLKTIRESMKDIEAAMGRDPANALLQELLVNTYQDEMRVLTAVHEASGAGRGI